MTPQFLALDPATFAPLQALDEAALRQRGARRLTCETTPGMPCRVSLEDARPGERVLLLTHRHLDVDTPYRADGPIYVREGAVRAQLAPGEVPALLRLRLLSLRAYDAKGYLRDADAVEGRDLEPVLARLLAGPKVARVQVHYAKTGCYACEVVPAAA
ncbi:MAG: DUF1203 domain-containing protein [Xanthomonadaceae bacterium]|jgi:hypothetical protein|nr:DUF1203 domain-containing protein [Xanthomonadaceae bacterium]